VLDLGGIYLLGGFFDNDLFMFLAISIFSPIVIKLVYEPMSPRGKTTAKVTGDPQQDTGMIGGG
jgi:hypothetical protein